MGLRQAVAEWRIVADDDKLVFHSSPLLCGCPAKIFGPPLPAHSMRVRAIKQSAALLSGVVVAHRQPGTPNSVDDAQKAVEEFVVASQPSIPEMPVRQS